MLVKDAFRKELEALINSHSMENGSDTPDFILARYLVHCLDAFDFATKHRTQWYEDPQPFPDDAEGGDTR